MTTMFKNEAEARAWVALLAGSLTRSGSRTYPPAEEADQALDAYRRRRAELDAEPQTLDAYRRRRAELDAEPQAQGPYRTVPPPAADVAGLVTFRSTATHAEDMALVARVGCPLCGSAPGTACRDGAEYRWPPHSTRVAKGRDVPGTPHDPVGPAEHAAAIALIDQQDEAVREAAAALGFAAYDRGLADGRVAAERAAK